MNEKLSLEKLALYQDQLLNDIEHKRVREAIVHNLDYQNNLHDLTLVHEILNEWGAKSGFWQQCKANCSNGMFRLFRRIRSTGFLFLLN